MCYWYEHPIPLHHNGGTPYEFFFKMCLYCIEDAQLMDQIELILLDPTRKYRSFHTKMWATFLHNKLKLGTRSKKFKNYFLKNHNPKETTYLMADNNIRFVRDIICSVENAKSP